MKTPKILLTAVFVLIVVTTTIVISKSTSAATCVASPTAVGTASTSIIIPATGTYRVWAHLYAPSSTDNSFSLQIANTSYCQTTVGGSSNVSPGAFTWVDYQNGTSADPISVTLNKGTYTLNLSGIGAGVGVDKLIFNEDTNCVPTGDGSNCETTTGTSGVATGSSASSPTPVATGSTVRTTTRVMGIIRLVTLQAPPNAVVTYAVDGKPIKDSILNTDTLSAGDHTITTTVVDSITGKTTHYINTIDVAATITKSGGSKLSATKKVAAAIGGLAMIVTLVYVLFWYLLPRSGGRLQRLLHIPERHLLPYPTVGLAVIVGPTIAPQQSALGRPRETSRLSPLLVVATFGVIGSVLLVTSFAATFCASVELASASVSNGASIMTNNNAIGGKMLVFNASTHVTTVAAGSSNSSSGHSSSPSSSSTPGGSEASSNASSLGSSGSLSGGSGTSSGSGSGSGSSGGGSGITSSYSCITSAAGGQCPSSGYYTDSQLVGVTNPWINQDEWGTNGTNYQQTLNANSPSDWYINASVSNNTSGAVLAFPNLGWSTVENPIDSYSSITSSWNVTIPTDSSVTDGWAAYDLWLNNWADEVMIQTDITANSDYDCSTSSIVVPDVAIDGQAWHMCQFGAERVWKPGPSDSNLRNEASGTVNVKDILAYMEQNGELPQNSTWTAGSFGFEVCNTSGTTQTFRVNGFTWGQD